MQFAHRTRPSSRVDRLVSVAESPRALPVIVVALLIAGSAAAQALALWPAGAPNAAVSSPPPEPALGSAEGSPSAIPSSEPMTPEPTPSPTASPTPSPTPTATPTPTPPTVVRFRPRDGWTGVSPWAAVSVRFTEAMDHASTEAAFSATIDGQPITGRVRWAEADTVLVLQPSNRMPYGVAVRLAVAAGARSQAGGVLTDAASITFVVAPRPTPAPTPRPTAPPTVTPTAPPPTPPPSPSSAVAWAWPLIGPITQRFGETLTQYGVHQGIDIDGDTGDSVRAAGSGTVVVAGQWDECGGLQVHVDHGGGVASWYRHLSRVSVAVGARVGRGAVIGAVGATGCATGSHLHFAIRQGRTFVDPLRYLPSR